MSNLNNLPLINGCVLDHLNGQRILSGMAQTFPAKKLSID